MGVGMTFSDRIDQPRPKWDLLNQWLSIAIFVFFVGGVGRSFLQNLSGGQEVGGAFVDALVHTFPWTINLLVLIDVVSFLVPRVRKQWLASRNTGPVETF
jgi:hypothetical protein